MRYPTRSVAPALVSDFKTLIDRCQLSFSEDMSISEKEWQ